MSAVDWSDPARDFVQPTPVELWAAVEHYAGRGWRVFPLGGNKRPCLPSPHPKGHGCKGQCGEDGHGCHDGTDDLERLERWWRAHPNAGIGLATGHAFDVLDLDRKPEVDGGEVIDAFAESHGHDWSDLADDDRSMVVATASGGLHFYVQPVIGSKNRATFDSRLPGCDWRTYGGFAVAPPTWSVGRRCRYVWLEGHQDRTPPACPLWLAALTRRDDETPGAAARPAHVTVTAIGLDATPYGASMLRGCCDEVAAAPDGQRNATLNGCAYRVGRFVAGGELDADFATRALVRAALSCGFVEGRAEGIIGSAFAAAKDDPARTPTKVSA